MEELTRYIVFAILVVIYVEFASCYFGDWCINDPRRAGRNMEMFSIYFGAGFLAAMTGAYIEKKYDSNKPLF